MDMRKGGYGWKGFGIRVTAFAKEAFGQMVHF